MAAPRSRIGLGLYQSRSLSGARTRQLTAAVRERFGADFGQRRYRRYGFGIDGQADNRRYAGILRRLERRGEVFRAFDRDAETAEGPRVGREIGIAQIGCDNAAGIFALLVHSDGAVDVVVGDDNDQRQLVLNGGGELLAVHQEIAVARNAPDRPLGKEPLHGDSGRHAVTHRARGRRNVLGKTAEAKEAVNPGGVIASAVAQDRVDGKIFPQPNHYRAEIDPAWLFGRLFRPGEIVGMRGVTLPAEGTGNVEVERGGECRRRRMNGEGRGVNAAELLGAGMHMHKLHLRPRDIEQRIALRRQFAHAAANDNDEVGGLDALEQVRIGTDAEIARVAWMQRVEQMQAPECRGDRQAIFLHEAAKMVGGLLRPAAAADNEYRPASRAEER